MPSQRQRASFEPVPPDLDLKKLVEKTPHFQYVDRISCDLIDQQGLEEFDKLVLVHCILGGKPLIIDGYDARLDEWTFSSKWLVDNHGAKVESARNITKQEPLPLSIGHYLRNMSRLTDQYFEKPENYRDKDRQRIYLKDIDPPPVWTDKLREVLPPNLFYLNESSGEVGGPGADDEKIPGGGMRRGRGIAPAGDLMSSLPPSMRAENIMAYIGHEGTYTPAHREMCASLGHNIMVENSNYLGDDGKPEKPGSSIWFMTETKDRQTVAEYWLSILGHDIEVEKHFAQVAAWKRAPFTVYVCEQKAGDFILIPPLAPHQVWNRGTRTMKVAWNRTTVETLEMALHEALPKSKIVCRDEQYKNKAIIYYTLHKYAALLNKYRDRVRTAASPEEQNQLRTSPKVRQLRKDFKRLFNLYKEIMLSEMFAPETTERNVQFLPFDSNVTCAYCRCNIFNKFLSCPHCEMSLGTDAPEPYDVCMECYAMGRSCYCISKLRWTEQFKWKDLTSKYETWRRLWIEIDGDKVTDATPLSIQEERARYPKNTLAQICQLQMKRRPWTDINKPPSEDEEDETDEDEQVQYNDDGTIKKKRKKKKRTETWLKNNRPCHVCAHRHPRWKMAECPCGRCWCYGTLFRGHDIMPMDVMVDPNWKCPHCQGICSAGNCRKDPRQTPYEPKGTLLGHDTRAVADARSVESLVDFSVSNLQWLKETVETPAENARLRKKQEEAEQNKLNDPTVDGEDEDEDDEAIARTGIEYSPSRPIDPALDADSSMIDPSLLGDSAGREETRQALPVATLLNEEDADGDADDDYAPARQNGFVAPAAVMYNQGDATPHSTPSTAGKKRKLNPEEVAALQARLGAKAARRDTGPVSGATKQYRKDHERRALEEARRNGRYIQVSAALKGKTKLVKLAISRARLRHFRDTVANASNELLASDVQPRDPQAAPGAAIGAAGAKGREKAVRIRTERDEDFQTRKRKKPATGKGQFARDVEEIDVPSDPEEDEEFGEQQAEGALELEGGRKRRRISQWQAARHAEHNDDDEFMALDDEGAGGVPLSNEEREKRRQFYVERMPERTKDGKFRKLVPSQPLTKREPTGRPRGRPPANGGVAGKAPAGKSVPGLRPSGGRVNGATDMVEVSSDSSSDDESDDDGQEGETPNKSAAEVQGDQNRIAKLAAGGMFEDDTPGLADEDATDEDADDSLFVKSVASKTGGLGQGIANIAKAAVNAVSMGATTPQQKSAASGKGSILNKAGPGGRKIKIVGKKKAM